MRSKLNILSIDVEDWYHSCYLKDYVNSTNYVSRISDSTSKIIELLDKYDTKATFFVLGEIAEKNPDLIRKIHSKGHEIGSHGYYHIPLWKQTPESLNKELVDTNTIIQSITEKKIISYRAPYASLDQSTAWAIKVLINNGIKYDSSIFPFKTPLYGQPGTPLSIYNLNPENIFEPIEKSDIIEIPFTIYKNKIITVPCTGGIYGRFIPSIFLTGLLKAIEKERPINFYFHPWEIDEYLPKLRVPLKNRIISYYNTKQYLKKIEILLQRFKFTSFERFFLNHT